jgi:hypothetical protein
MDSINEPVKAALAQLLPPTWWEGLCGWLTANLKDMEMSLERREAGGDWNVECLLRPLQEVTTHQTPNGVQILSIRVGMNGKSRIFELAGPESISLSNDAAGFPVRVEIRSHDSELVLVSSGPLDPQKKQSSNAWGE